MKILVIILWIVCASYVAGCASLFRDPLLAEYQSGRISKEEFERRSLEQEEALARSAPAHWQLQQTAAENHSELNPTQ